MTFNISCATFARLAPVALQPGEKLVQLSDPRPYLSCVRIEHSNGMALAIATNSCVMAIEYLGDVPAGPNIAINIGLSPTLVAQCIKEAPFNSTLTISNMTATTTLGFKEMAIADQKFVDWRKAIPTTLPKKSKGGMVLDSDHCSRLMRSAPSGTIVFPLNFDPDWVVAVRDPHSDNWYGTFLSREIETQTPAEVPDWINHARS